MYAAEHVYTNLVGGLDPGANCVIAVVDADFPRIHRNGAASHALQIKAYRVLSVCKFPIFGPWPATDARLFFEGQDLNRKSKRGDKPGVRPQDILKLAMRAGAQAQHTAGRLSANTSVYQLPVKVWKGRITPGQDAIAKEQFCNRIWSALAEDERAAVERLGTTLRLDALDAIGIAWAGASMSAAELKPHLLGRKDGFV